LTPIRAMLSRNRKADVDRRCNICGFDFQGLPATEVNCRGKCKSTPRARTVPLVCRFLASEFDRLGPLSTRRLLGFAMSECEVVAINPYFSALTSVSLYGSYRNDHIEGVDARDLSRFDANSFQGVFGILVFDYFEEHEKALAEVHRALAPGGVFFTHIAPYRLLDGDEPPVNTATIKKRPGYFDYVPDNASMASIKVGRRWLISAIERSGLSAKHVVMKDPVSGEPIDWFVGVKPREVSPVLKVQQASSTVGAVRPREHRAQAKRSEFSLPSGGLALQYVAELSDNPDARGIVVTLSALATPKSIDGFGFAGHGFDGRTRKHNDTLVLAGTDAIGVSNDLGQTWRRVDLPEKRGLRLWNAVSTHNGNHLVQAVGWGGASEGPCDEQRDAVMFVFDPDWRLVGQTRAGFASWHGTSSIGESEKAVMFGDYFENAERYRRDFEENKERYLRDLKCSAIWRSLDGGFTWHKSFEKGPLQIRHFHTVQVDPFESATWWASSGDKWWESHVWRSKDDGETWQEVSNPSPEVELPLAESRKSSCQRFTDMVIEADRLIWGADDFLGSTSACDPSLPLAKRSGSRVFTSPKTEPLQPTEVAYLGHPVRKFVDVGPGWIIVTEAKQPCIGFRPQIFFLGKRNLDLSYLFDVDNERGSPTGFTYSKGSDHLRNGSFFTYKFLADALTTPTKCLRWDVEFF
jgi:SAM-dependent methyltransferase